MVTKKKLLVLLEDFYDNVLKSQEWIYIHRFQKYVRFFYIKLSRQQYAYLYIKYRRCYLNRVRFLDVYWNTR